MTRTTSRGVNPMVTADSLVAQLEQHFYGPREWVVLRQVPNGTGAGAGRTADAVAMNCWPSRGMEIHGFEIKTARGDWLREVRAPEKAEAVAQYCDRWFIVVPSRTLVEPRELPPTWGLIVLDEKPSMTHAQRCLRAKRLDRGFLAAVLRALRRAEGVPPDRVQALEDQARTEGYRAGYRARPDSRLDDLRWHLNALKRIEEQATAVARRCRQDSADLRKLVAGPPPAAVPEGDGS